MIELHHWVLHIKFTGHNFSLGKALFRGLNLFWKNHSSENGKPCSLIEHSNLFIDIIIPTHNQGWGRLYMEHDYREREPPLFWQSTTGRNDFAQNDCSSAGGIFFHVPLHFLLFCMKRYPLIVAYVDSENFSLTSMYEYKINYKLGCKSRLTKEISSYMTVFSGLAGRLYSPVGCARIISRFKEIRICTMANVMPTRRGRISHTSQGRVENSFPFAINTLLGS